MFAGVVVATATLSACTSDSDSKSATAESPANSVSADTAESPANSASADSAESGLAESGASGSAAAGSPEASSQESTAGDSTGATPDETESSASAASTAPGGDAATAVSDPPPVAVAAVSIPPGQAKDGFVGAASDVTTEVCKLDGDHWSMSGLVKNSSGSAARYRIYVALNAVGSTDTRALIQTDVKVDNGATVPWSARADVTDDVLQCILRVERVKA